MKKIGLLILSIISLFGLAGCLSKEEKNEINDKVLEFFPNYEFLVDSAEIKLPRSFDVGSVDVYFDYNFESNDIVKGKPERIGDVYYFNYEFPIKDTEQQINCKLMITYYGSSDNEHKYKNIDLVFNLVGKDNFKYNLLNSSKHFEILDNNDIKYYYKYKGTNYWSINDLLYSLSSKTVTFIYESRGEYYNEYLDQTTTTRQSYELKLNYESMKLEIKLGNGTIVNIDLLKDSSVDEKYVDVINSMLWIIEKIDNAAKISGESQYLSPFVNSGYDILGIIS